MPEMNSTARRILPEWIRRRLRLARWWSLAGIRILRSALGVNQRSLFVIGDSHAKFNFGTDPRIRLWYLGPVTMHRIARDGRKALSLKDRAVFRGDVVAWCLGEIDVRSHLVGQRDRQGIPAASLADSLAGDFLRSVAAIEAEIGGLNTVILSVIPPTDQGENESYPKIGSLAERIDARRALNRALEKYCPEHGYTYLDPYGPLEDSSGALRAELSDGNVHCGPASAPLVAAKLLDVSSPWLGNARR
jgi:hypothetical protein